MTGRAGLSTKARRRLLFWGFFFLLPWPIAFVGSGLVPAVRYVILAGVASAVAIAEGAAGPVSLVVALLVGWSLATTLGCWLLARISAWILDGMPPRLADLLCGAGLLIAVGVALIAAPYHTPFGRSARGGLLEILS